MHKSLRTFYTVQMNSFLAGVSLGELTDYLRTNKQNFFNI